MNQNHRVEMRAVFYAAYDELGLDGAIEALCSAAAANATRWGLKGGSSRACDYAPEVSAAARLYGMTIPGLFADSKERRRVQARAVAALAMRTVGYSYPEIGRLLRRDHSTAINAVRIAERNPMLRAQAEQVARTVAGKEAA